MEKRKTKNKTQYNNLTKCHICNYNKSYNDIKYTFFEQKKKHFCFFIFFLGQLYLPYLNILFIELVRGNMECIILTTYIQTYIRYMFVWINVCLSTVVFNLNSLNFLFCIFLVFCFVFYFLIFLTLYLHVFFIYFFKFVCLFV